MQLFQTSFLSKTNTAITSALRNTSCNRGWLQLFTHIVCGTFTVTCFVFILLTTLQVFQRSDLESRCHAVNCRIVCHGAPYNGQYEDDVILTTVEAEMNCQHVFLSLYEPSFTNESLPENWLARLRQNVIELGIIGGNLHHIPPNVFSGAFARHIQILILENVTISSWTQYMLIGLANLDHLFIRDCDILDLQEYALAAVSQTLTALTVTGSGLFDPSRITGLAPTGLPELTTVDLSFNAFGSTLGNTSFAGLRFCKSLYLSSSKISYIGSGTFDSLHNIEYLNLNNNFLKVLEPGLFKLIASKNWVRINLLDNPWHCDCAARDLRRLVRNKELLVDPMCQSPKVLRGKTFTEFHNRCNMKELRKLVVADIQPPILLHVDEKDTVHSINSSNEELDLLGVSPILVPPFERYKCATERINTTRLRLPSVAANIYDATISSIWLKSTLVIRGKDYTMIELGLSRLEGYGLLWYRSSCPNEIFCINIVPEVIRFYNMNLANQYTFCPIALASGYVDNDQCVAYSSEESKIVLTASSLLWYALIGGSCLVFGALCLYLLIRQYPSLLRGSKRVLFVKHKTVDALVLPPKVPLRSSLLSDESVVQFNDISLFRSGSVRSSNSYAPSYISALQPSDEQLATWRQKHGNDKYEGTCATISIISSEMSPISISSGTDNLYFSLEGSSRSTSICNS